MSHILFLCCQSFVLDLPYAFQLHVKVFFSNRHFISSYNFHTVNLQVSNVDWQGFCFDNIVIPEPQLVRGKTPRNWNQFSF